MEISYGTGLGLQNRYDALNSDTSVDPMEAISKTANKRSKKIKQKNNSAQDNKSKVELEKAQIKSKAPQVQINNHSCQKSIKGKPAAKPAKQGKSAVSEPEKPLQVTFERLLTLDEYREANKGNLCMAPQYNLRQPGEGEDLSQWGKLVPLMKKKYQQEEEEREVESETCKFKQRAGRLRHLRVCLTFGDSLVREHTTQRALIAARLATTTAAAAAAADASPAPLQRQRPPRVDNAREFPTLGN